MIIESDEASLHQLPDYIEPKAAFFRTANCDTGAECLPLSECSFMQYQAAKTCLAGDRSLSCGKSEVEPYMCCPRSQFDSVNSVKACGKTLVTGQYYKGLGSFPFVARIGFKSKYTQTFYVPV